MKAGYSLGTFAYRAFIKMNPMSKIQLFPAALRNYGKCKRTFKAGNTDFYGK